MRHSSALRRSGLALILFSCLLAHGWGEDLRMYLVSQTATPGSAAMVKIAGTMAYVCDTTEGLRIYDISNPGQPVFKGAYRLDGASASDVAFYGSFVYLTARDSGSTPHGGTYVLDISNPSTPQRLNFLPTTGPAGDGSCAVSGNRLLITTYGGNKIGYFTQLLLMDLTDPANPRKVDQWLMGGFPNRMQVSGNYAAVAHTNSGVKIFDISSPSRVWLKSRYVESYATDAAFLGKDLVFSMFGNYSDLDTASPGIQILELNQSTVTPRGAYYTRSDVNSLCTRNRLIFLAASDLGIIALAAPTLDQIIEKGTYDTPGSASGVTADDKYLYVADGAAGFEILRYSDAPVTTDDDAIIISHTIPGAMTAGQTITATVTVANQSKNAWTLAKKYRLALTKPSPLWTLPCPRIDLPSGVTVPPNGETTFSLTLKAPNTAGTYPIELRMARDSSHSFGEKLVVPVSVTRAAMSLTGSAGMTQNDWKAYK